MSSTGRAANGRNRATLGAASPGFLPPAAEHDHEMDQHHDCDETDHTLTQRCKEPGCVREPSCQSRYGEKSYPDPCSFVSVDEGRLSAEKDR